MVVMVWIDNKYDNRSQYSNTAVDIYIYIYKINKIMGFIYVAPSTMYNFLFLKKYLGYALLSTSVTDESDSSI